MKTYVKDRSGREHSVELYGWEDGRATVCIDDCNVVTLKTYCRNERTWNDHMGNTPCGYYVNVPITSRERKRVYLK